MKTEFYSQYYAIENSHWWFRGRWRIVLDLVHQQFDGRQGRLRALDVGCGTGVLLGLLDPLGTAIGLDCASEAVNFCQQRGRIRVVQGFSTALPFENDSFDLVCGLDMLEHVEDDCAVLREFFRVCRPGGRVLITVPAYRFLWGRQDEISNHFRRYVAAELEQKLISAGLATKRLTYFNTLLFPLIAAIRLARHLLPQTQDPVLHSDFEMTPSGRINDFLAGLFSTEAALLSQMSLPFGVSILALATKVEHECAVS